MKKIGNWTKRLSQIEERLDYWGYKVKTAETIKESDVALKFYYKWYKKLEKHYGENQLKLL